ncbi:MAG: hypothetical protein EAX96_10495 [Candidatus Lokiarchaeota archaeon]|nr:hypothetical protein [Candidatus Lokiarchaeota archaeon]
MTLFSFIFSIIVFIIVILFVIIHPIIKIPRINKEIKIDYGIAPLIGVLILIFSFNFHPSVIINGILGTSNIQPYAILILFMSLAYICISIDMTGLFSYLALQAAKKSGGSGKKLFLYFFFLSSVLTIFTSNDIVILTITPIICYFAKHAKINPIPFLISQFFAANIWSMMLYIGNPTNIIVAQAYGLLFFEYTIWMFIPTLVAGFSCFFLLFQVFKKDISNNIILPEINPKKELKDKNGAIFGVVILGTCLFFLSISPLLKVDMWLISVIFALIMFNRDIINQMILQKRQNNKNTKPIISKFETIKRIYARMPWKIVPFILGMFILVEILTIVGWTSILSESFSLFGNITGFFPSILLMGYSSAFISNLMNNQPMTIFFTRMLQNTTIKNVSVRDGMIFALIMGSNLGANFTLIGALAGIMWSKITEDKGVKISFTQFARYGFLIMPIVVFLSCFSLFLEIIFFR